MEDIALHVAGTTVRHRNSFENLEVPRNDDELPHEFVQKWVVQFYMSHLAIEDEKTIKTFAKAANEIGIDIVKKL